MHRKLVLLLTSSALAGMAACAQLPHNNVLLFGTDTKVALDISSSATSGGAPQITVGYRRAEAVWMPLVANRRVCKNESDENCVVETAVDKDGNKETVSVLTANDIGDSKGKDAYSVFASFGAKFSGEAGPAAEGVSASGGLAQFFATGIAAQRVADSGQLGDILKVSSEGEAKAKAAEAETRKVELLSEQQIAAIDRSANQTSAELTLVANCLRTAAGRTKFLAGVPNEFKEDRRFTKTTIDGLTTDAMTTSWWNLLNAPRRNAAMKAYTNCT